jgi:hypothetical protein
MIVYFGHHKAATTWVTYVLGHACRVRNLTLAYAHNDESLNAVLEAGNADVLAYVNAEIKPCSAPASFSRFPRSPRSARHDRVRILLAPELTR